VRHVVRGEPIKRIDALRQEIGADLIAVGSTGKGAVERALLGSVSQRIVRSSPVPVLTVH
jgi:nucleotide-binding universal stress UspA family protein